MKVKTIEIIFFYMYLSVVLLGLKEFTVWSQVTAFLTPNNTTENLLIIENLITMQHPHALRVLLLLPVYAISEYMSLELNYLFSIVLVALIYCVYLLCASIVKDTVSRKALLPMLFFFMIISFFMNGRIVFAIVGNTLLLYLLYRSFYTPLGFKKKKLIPFFILALWLVFVSSGSFFVFLLTTVVFFTINVLVRFSQIRKKIFRIFSVFTIALIVMYPIIITFFEKNVQYYDNSIFGMLSHGLGIYLVEYIYIMYIFFLLVIFSLPISISFLRRYNILVLPLSMMLSSFAVGLFGFSALLSGIPAYLIFFYMFIDRKKYKGLKYV